MFHTLQKQFEEVQNPKNAAQMAAYMRNQFRFYGIKTPERRKIYRETMKALKKKGEVDWRLADLCWNDPHREFQYFVVDYLGTMQKDLVFDDVPRIETYIRSKQWWDTIDGLDRIVGRIAFVDDRIDALMLRWSVDPDFWVRRVAIDHQLGRKEKTDPKLLETILVNNFGSDEFFINKAIGWSLREYSKTNPGWVRQFLDRYRDRLHPLSRREAQKYV